MKTKIFLGMMSIILSILLGVVTFNLLMNLFPPLTDDGHKYMPTQNIFISFLISLISLPILCFFAIKIHKNR